jgi:simple sugar transport system ATP-binding protein
VPRLSLTENILLTAYRKGMLALGLIRFGAAKRFAEECIQRFDVKCGGPGSEAKSLSGGNLQKFIVGREIMQNPKLLVLAQPTWGVDVGAASSSAASCWTCGTPAPPSWWSRRSWTSSSRSATASW